MSSTPESPLAEPNEPGSRPTPIQAPVRKHHKHRRSSWFKRIRRRIPIHVKGTTAVLVILALVSVVVVGVLVLVLDSVNEVETSQASFQRVADSLTTVSGTDLTLNDFDRLDSSIVDLMNSLSDAKSRLNILQPFTFLSHQLTSTIATVDAAQHLATSAHEMLNGLQPTLFFLVSGNDSEAVVTQISSAERVVELLGIGRGQFADADKDLQIAKTDIASLNLDGADSSLILNVQELIKYQDQLTQINSVLTNSPDLLTSVLGLSGSKNYLILSQNNDELRPSGGYISTYGWLTMRNGRVTNYSYSATSTTSPNPPPANTVAQLNMPSWWLQYQQPIYAAWDGSWYADFPSTAKMSMWYYNAGSNPQAPVDGAIAIDITGFENLLSVIGSVTVPGFEKTPVTADNFRSVIYNIRDFGGADEPHKRFLTALYQQIFADWQNISFDPAKNTLLLGAILKALQEKHIMMYFSDTQMDQAVDLLGWSGAQTPATDHDYLMVADANLGNKSNHSINRSLTYDADIQDDGTIKGHATIAYDYSAHTAADDPGVNPEFNGPADYSNLAQIFVSKGTTLTASANLLNTPTIVDNATSTEFVTQLYVPFDSDQSFQFSYTTKPLIETLGSYKRYRLLLQKQPGTDANAVSLQIILPANAKLISSAPAADASYSLDRPILEFRTDLSTDRWIEIIYQDATS